ncbi:hypothetical protein NQ315_005101 [Exocentrus adspersus]|uniref:RNA (guanine-9-)-methyltransferase domain-containing protein 1 n=1 Tax=Exocentrus adspersus TaxID=1586481 RepID=A0AAV8VUF2_9CUCU|nr:hypothetical protein NQ315_005101 [Exocentrus adspersus]
MYSFNQNSFKIIKCGIVGLRKYIHGKLVNDWHAKNEVNSIILSSERKCSSSTESHKSEDTKVNIEHIANGDKELEHKLKVILLEAEVMRQEGKPVPEESFLTVEHWKELLELPTRSSRRKYFEFLLKKEAFDIQREAEKRPETLEEFASKYDLSHNNIFLRFYDSTMNQMYNSRLIQAMMFGQKLVVDCGYDENMSKRENLNCAKQLMLLFAENRAHDDPFDLHFCNADPNGILIKQFAKFIPNVYEPSFPLNLHQASYLDLFPRDQLVYLTPHCKQEMTEFDHDTIYIIGGIVDKVNNEPLSLAKAKREGIRMAKFPLDKYLLWGSGSGKSLTLNQVGAILNDVKLKGNWEYAFRHVPKRKIVEYTADNNKGINDRRERFRLGARKRWVPATSGNFRTSVSWKK